MRTQFLTAMLAITTLIGCNQGETITEKKSADEFVTNIEGPVIIVVDNPSDSGSSQTKKQTDIFTQSSNNSNKVDILWNIDNSGSMQDEQLALAENFDLFISDFIVKDIDFKMAITTTDPDPGKDGNIIGNSDQYLTSAAAKSDEDMFVDDFQTLINVGTGGSGDEQGLRTTRSFYQKNGSSFVRSGALQVVVIVSDEDDANSESVDSLLAQIKAASNPNIKIYSIVDTTSNSVSSSGQAKRGFRYILASERVGGTVSDIEGSFADALQGIGEDIVSLAESFVLSQVPTRGGRIKVLVNGISQSAVNYSYSSATNSIKFYDGHIPAAGSQVVIEYTVPN